MQKVVYLNLTKGQKNMSNNSNLSWKNTLLALTLAILGVVLGAYLAFSPKNSETTSTLVNTEISIPEESYDWGEIDINGGVVNHSFIVKNEGNETLDLSNITTSCMCTTAKLIGDAEESPVYGMHSQSNYIMELAPQQSAKLYVEFDPAYHGPTGTGPITRIITIDTNDSDNKILNFTLTGTVISN